MSPLLELLNRLLEETLALHASSGVVQVRRLELDDEGARILLHLEPPAGTGELTLRLRAEAPQGEAQVLMLTVAQGPEQWPTALEPFRRVIERARLRLELDFSP